MNQGENNTDKAAANWGLLWTCFEQITCVPKDQQPAVLDKLKDLHPELFPELKNLLQSHQTENSILDKDLADLALASPFQLPESIGGFKILESLGSGGLGDVYKACKDEDGFERFVAIKVAPSGQYASMVIDSFNNELNMLLSLNHPNIERLFEGGVTKEGIPYLVVEYIDGQHIDRYCDQQTLNLQQRIKLMLQVCEAVATMHQSLIIHRDIKASNIMVDAKGTVKLLDFGLAKLTENQTESQLKKDVTQQTASGFMMTLAYASPEQIRGQNITTATDVYAIGMLLYYLLAGRLPYTINNHDLVALAKQVNDLRAPLASQNINMNAAIFATQPGLKKKLKGDLDAILAKAINKEPERRYLSAQQLADDLKRYLNNEPVLAKPDKLFYRMRKFIQRHAFGVVTTAAVMLSLLLLSVLLFNRTQELEGALQATQEEQQRVNQITDFLIDVFKLSDPLQNQSDVVDVKSLLDYSSQQLDGQFNQQPATKAKLYQTLASVYLNMSDIESAEKLLNQAKQLTAINAPMDQLAVTLIETELRQKQGQLQEALSLLNLFDKKHPNIELPLALILKKSLMKGQLLYQLGELDQAVDLLQGASQVLDNQNRSNDASVNIPTSNEQLQADIYYLLGNVYWKKGDLAQVEVNYQKSFDSNTLRLGVEHHATLKSLSALGVLAYSQGHYELAKSRFQQVLVSRVKQLGNHHYLTADAHNRLGATEYELGHLKAAEAHYMQAMESLAASGLNESIKFTRVLNNLGLIKRQQKAYQQAEQLFQQALDIQTKLLGNGHPDLAAMLNNLGLSAYDQSNFELALDWFKQAYQVQFEANGLNNVNIAFAMTNMGRMYMHLKQPEDAINWINQALQLRAAQIGTDHLLYAATLMAEAELNMVIKNHEKAAKSAEQAYNIRKNQLELDDWRLADSRHLLFSLTQSNDHSLEQLCADVAIIKQRFGAEHPRSLSADQRMRSLTLHCAE